MKDETRKERKLRKKLEKKHRKLTQKLLSLEKKLRGLQQRKQSKAAQHGAPTAKFNAASKSRRKAKRRVVARAKKATRTVKPKTAFKMPNKVMTRAPRMTLPPPRRSALTSAALSVPTQSAATGDDHAKHNGDAGGVT